MKKDSHLHIFLFVLTFISTLLVGAYHEKAFQITGIWPPEITIENPIAILKGLPFSLTLLTILLAHESAHYLLAKRHGVEATLPYFIPAPTFFGTFGAFIKMKSPITTKNALMDIGASGPIAGFIVSIFAVVIGLSMSHVAVLPQNDEPVMGTSLLFWWLSKLILGSIPLDSGVEMHSVALAGWIGFFVTSLNLIPVGQLDGGHILYALIGERHVKYSKILVGILVIMGVFVYEGWLLWAVLLVILGLRHPPIIYEYEPLDRRRKIVGWMALVIFVLTFTPIPIVMS